MYRGALDATDTAILIFIASYRDQQGKAPYLREIGAAVCLSTSRVHSRLRALERWKYVRLGTATQRSTQITEKGRAWVDTVREAVELLANPNGI